MNTVFEPAFMSAKEIYVKDYHEEPSSLVRQCIKRNGNLYYVYNTSDDDHRSIMNQRKVAVNPELPNDKFWYDPIVCGVTIYAIIWEYNDHANDPIQSIQTTHGTRVILPGEEYKLYMLPKYNNHDLYDIFWCEKFGFLQRLSGRKFIILPVKYDDHRNGTEGHVEPYGNRRYVNLKIYLKVFERKYKKTLKHVHLMNN